MNNKVTKELIQEQDAIVNSNDKKIIVSAGPGSGKTYTIIKKATKELKYFELKKINKGIIICSFTKESSLELNKRLSKEINNDFSFIGTIDSFILKEIINPFKNRILKKIKPNSKLIKGKIQIYIPTINKYDEVNKLIKEGLNNFNKKQILEYYNNWIDNLILGKYEVSFATYLFSKNAINEVSELKKYCQTRFSSIYIDEAQDLNYFQIKFIEKFIEITDINCYLIGDRRQSIFGFRGSDPKLFYSMKKYGFIEFKITHSARCHYNILEFSRRIVGESNDINKLKNDNKVRINYSIIHNLDFLKKIDNYFILVETNKEAINIYEKCHENGITNIIYSKKIDLKDNKKFSDNYYNLVEEILKFFFNHNNKEPQLTYSIQDLIPFLESIIDIGKLNEKNLSINEDNVVDYLIKIFLLGKIEIPKIILDKIKEQLSQDIYKNQYIRYKNKNRIMTIHSSKGLEAKNVFVQFVKKD